MGTKTGANRVRVPISVLAVMAVGAIGGGVAVFASSDGRTGERSRESIADRAIEVRAMQSTTQPAPKPQPSCVPGAKCGMG